MCIRDRPSTSFTQVSYRSTGRESQSLHSGHEVHGDAMHSEGVHVDGMHGHDVDTHSHDGHDIDHSHDGKKEKKGLLKKIKDGVDNMKEKRQQKKAEKNKGE